MKILLIVVSSVLSTAVLVDAMRYQFPVVTLKTPEDSICPSASEMKAVRMNITSSVSRILQEIAAGFNQTIGEVDQSDTTTHTVPECGGSGWRQVAFLNMTDPNQQCPDSWKEYSQNSVRACGRQKSDIASCDAVEFSTNTVDYTHVCGRIVGYQFGSPDGWTSTNYISLTPGNEINEPYLDGVSVTYGNPRQHIWTLYGAVWPWNCCSGSPISFVEQNYFCDTGNPLREYWSNLLFISFPLWDDEANCPDDANCCASHSRPWFNTTLADPTTEDIEVRICGDEQSSNEDTPLELIEIYVK